MNNDVEIIGDLHEINQTISKDLWNMVSVKTEPAGPSPRLIFPIRREGSIRISEKEAEILCCGLLNNFKDYYYSVETPTEQTYIQSGQRGPSARSDLSLYVFKDRQFLKVVNIEFKAHACDPKNIAKDIEKLGREGITGNWFHTLGNLNKGTFLKLFQKFETAFLEYRNEFSSLKKISVLFCFCVLKKRLTYTRHFLCRPSEGGYDEYVKNFFDSQRLDRDWDIFGDPASPKREVEVREDPENNKPGSTKNKIKCEKFWEEELDFMNVQRTQGSSGKHKNRPRIWFYPEKFQIAPEGKGNKIFKDLRQILMKYYPDDVRGKATVRFTAGFSWQKFAEFVKEVKNICKQ
jgi:hypothetical protein